MTKIDKQTLLRIFDEEIEEHRKPPINVGVIEGLRLAQAIVRKFKGADK